MNDQMRKLADKMALKYGAFNPYRDAHKGEEPKSSKVDELLNKIQHYIDHTIVPEIENGYEVSYIGPKWQAQLREMIKKYVPDI